jgi:tetratricopeptide (TPR) repeat protein
MILEDFSFSLFRRVALEIGLSPWFGVVALVATIGLISVLYRRLRVFGSGLFGVVVAGGCFGLLAISECQTEMRLTPNITARAHTFTDASRESAQFGLLVIPVLAVLVVVVRRKLALERRRTLLSTYLRIANKAFYDGDFDRAIAEYSIAIRVDAARVESHLKRGQAYLEKGDYVRAVADFNRTIALDPDCASAYLHRGMVEAARGENEAAIIDFERAIDVNPGQAISLLYRGLSLAKIGETSRAADDFRRVLKLTNHSDFVEPAKFHLAMIENELPARSEAMLVS